VLKWLGLLAASSSRSHDCAGLQASRLLVHGQKGWKRRGCCADRVVVLLLNAAYRDGSVPQPIRMDSRSFPARVVPLT